MIKIKLKNLEEKIDGNLPIIIVGPNNSGKSLLLQEIYNFFHQIYLAFNSNQQKPTFAGKILESIPINFSQKDLETWVIPTCAIETKLDKKCVRLNGRYIPIAEFENSEEIKNRALHLISKQILSLKIHERSSIINGGDFEGYTENSTNAFTIINFNSEKKKQLKKLIQDSLNLILTFRTLEKGRVKIGIADKEPENEFWEQFQAKEAFEYHKEHSKELSNFSDGIVFFISILFHLIAYENYLALIDEPEACLAPPLARNLGNLLAQQNNLKKLALIASTHSSDFLIGCLESKTPINLVRLTYSDSNKQATATLLSHAKLLKWMQEPLIRHTGFLKALFYPYTIICEADGDRVFYEEINQRLVDNNQGIKDCLFLNSPNGKDKISSIVDPLIQMGINVVSIVDFDILKERTLSKLLKSYKVPKDRKAFIENLASEVKKYLDNKPMTIDNLAEIKKEQAKILLKLLAELGIFIVPFGELENWKFHGKKINSSDWLSDAFEIMGNDPSEPNYMKPNNDEIWKFIQAIGIWLITKKLPSFYDDIFKQNEAAQVTSSCEMIPYT